MNKGIELRILSAALEDSLHAYRLHPPQSPSVHLCFSASGLFVCLFVYETETFSAQMQTRLRNAGELILRGTALRPRGMAAGGYRPCPSSPAGKFWEASHCCTLTGTHSPRFSSFIALLLSLTSLSYQPPASQLFVLGTQRRRLDLNFSLLPV